MLSIYENKFGSVVHCRPTGLFATARVVHVMMMDGGDDCALVDGAVQR